MRLTQKLKGMIVERFMDGQSMTQIALWYDKPGDTIEAVIREAMIADRLNRHVQEGQRRLIDGNSPDINQ